MKRLGLLSIALFSLWCCAASAQVYPNIPPNTLLGRLGSGTPGPPQPIPIGIILTPLLANPTASVGLTAVNGSAPTVMRSDAAPPLSQAIIPTWTGTHTFAPPSGTTTQAIVMNGTLPSSGSSSTTFNFAEFNGTNPGYTVGGSTIDPNFGGLPSTSTVHAYYTANGGSTITAALYGSSRETAASSNIVGVIGSGFSLGVVATNDGLWGVIGFTNVSATAHVGATIAVDGESVIATGGQVDRRVAVAGSSQTSVQGSLLDTAFAVADGGAAGAAPYDTHGPWQNAFTLSRILYGNQGPPLSTTGTVFYADTAFTTLNYSDMHLVTFTGNLFNFTNFAIGADGHGVIGGGTTALPTGSEKWKVFASGGGQIQNFADVNGTSGFDGLQISTTSFASEIVMGVAEASNSAARFGLTLGNYAEVVTAGASSNGLLIGAITSKPVIFGTNNVEQGRITLSGGLAWGLTTDTTAGVINVLTGFRINSAATSGNVLRGNGTNFVSAQLAFSDLSGSLACGQLPALTGDVTSSACATTVAKIAGTTVSGTTGTTNVVFSASPTLTGIPVLANPTATSFSLNQAISAAAWTTNGVRYKNVAVTLTDTTSSGTVAKAYTSVFGGDTIAASSATTYTDYYAGYFSNPVAGTNVTITNKYALGADTAKFGGGLSVTTDPLFVAFDNNSGAAVGIRVQNLNSGASAFSGMVYVDNAGTTSVFQGFGNSTHEMRFNNTATSGTFNFLIAGTSALLIANTRDVTLSTQLNMPNITTTSAAQTGTVCWTTGTGKFTVDTTVGCLTSLAKAKNIDAGLSPRYALNIVERLQPISFRYKQGWGDSGHYEQFGFTADQAATIDERLVGRDPDGNLQGFRYQEYGAVLTAAMQALKADNDNIREELTELKRRIAR